MVDWTTFIIIVAILLGLFTYIHMFTRNQHNTLKLLQESIDMICSILKNRDETIAQLNAQLVELENRLDHVQKRRRADSLSNNIMKGGV